jgi:hypothetical protein
MAEAIERADARGTLALRRVSDSREEGLQPSLLVTGRQRDAVSSIVVSARGWLVVNPSESLRLRLGGNEHPSQQLHPFLKLFLISVLFILHLEIHMLTYMLIEL